MWALVSYNTFAACRGLVHELSELVWILCGLLLADSLRTRDYLEATPDGYSLYVKYGFKAEGEMVLDYSSLGVEGEEYFHLMIRDPVSRPTVPNGQSG